MCSFPANTLKIVQNYKTNINFRKIFSRKLHSSNSQLHLFNLLVDFQPITHYCQVLVVGAGSAGCTVASRLAKKLKKSKIYILEPGRSIYYHPSINYIAGGLKNGSDNHSMRWYKDILPQFGKWIHNNAAEFAPAANAVITQYGDVIYYDFLVISTGVEPIYDDIPGLERALKSSSQPVCSSACKPMMMKTKDSLQRLRGGEAVFTCPATPVTYEGIALEIMFLADAFLRHYNKRYRVNISFNTASPTLYENKYYKDSLRMIADILDIKINLRTSLEGICVRKNVAKFRMLDRPGECYLQPYDFLHVVPPLATPNAIFHNQQLVDHDGYVTVDKYTLQHTKFPNIFAVGSCNNTPTAKTQIASYYQGVTASQNIESMIKGKEISNFYTGLTAHALLTGCRSAMFTQTDYSMKPTSVFPFQKHLDKFTPYFIATEILPRLYWYLITTGTSPRATVPSNKLDDIQKPRTSIWPSLPDLSKSFIKRSLSYNVKV